jgi:hypothetical protein
MSTKASRRHSEGDMESLRTAAYHNRETMKALRSVGYDGLKPKSATKAIDESMTLTERQIAMYDTYESLVEEYGVFNQGIGANGAHYGPGDVNSFKAEGIMCGACVFYMEGKCEIVEGIIDPEGVCKLWIIPESALNLVAPEEEAVVEDEVVAEEEAMVEEALSSAHMDDEEDMMKTASLDGNAIINAEAAKNFARRLLGVK